MNKLSLSLSALLIATGAAWAADHSAKPAAAASASASKADAAAAAAAVATATAATPTVTVKAAAGKSATAASGAGSAAPATAMTEGEVRKVDMENKKITLKHGEIKNLGMPGMTMVFQLGDAAQADKLKAGDKVRFAADKQGSAYIVTKIDKQ